MNHKALAIKRKNILGTIYDLCDEIENIPVYLNDKSEEPLGYVDESLGRYTDAFLFHLPENVCKQLSSGQFSYVFDYELAGESGPRNKKRIKLNYILLVPKTIRR